MNCVYCGKKLSQNQIRRKNETCSRSCSNKERAKKRGGICGYDLVCSFCGKKFHTRVTNRKFCCHKCYSETIKGKQRDLQWRNKISETQKKKGFKIVSKFECERCGLIFNSNTSLRAHKAHCGHVRNKVRCEICGKEVYKSALKFHTRKHGPKPEWAIKLDAETSVRIRKRLKENAQRFNGTDIEELFEKRINELNLTLFKQYEIEGCNHVFDFYIPSMDLLVELDGDYWHGNTDYDKMTIFQKKAFFNDKNYYKKAIKLGHKIIRFWGSTFLKNTDNCIKETLEYGQTGKYSENRLSRCL